MFEELDVVQLNKEMHGLKKGSIGTIVHIYKKNVAAEVEFMTDEGKTIDVVTLNFSDLSKLKTKNTYEKVSDYRSFVMRDKKSKTN